MPTFLSTDRLNLLLALVAALTGTWWGAAAALLVLVVTACRHEARRHLPATAAPSGAVRRWAVTAAQHAHLLHAARHRGEPTARA